MARPSLVLSAEQEKLAGEMTEAGCSARKIAIAIGVSRGTFAKLAYRFGSDMYVRKWARAQRHKEGWASDLLEYRELKLRKYRDSAKIQKMKERDAFLLCKQLGLFGNQDNGGTQ